MLQELEPKKCWSIYFQPGQIIFHVTEEFDGDLTSLTDWAKGVAEKKGKNVTFSVPQGQVFKFATSRGSASQTYSRPVSKAYPQRMVADQQWKLPSVASIFRTAPRAKMPPPFSLVFVNVESPKWPAFKADECDENNKNLEAQEAQKLAVKELFSLIRDLDDDRKNAPVKLGVVSPNWLVSSNPASEPGGTGGPGGKPSPVKLEDVGIHNFNSPSMFYPSGVPSIQPGDGNGVVVAILDTSYSVEQLEKIKTDWPKHDLIQKLLGTPGALRGVDGELNVHPDSLAENYLPGVKIDGHYDYDMTDHGLFVAGIINCIAPQAELHLYQVLNQYGLGDLLSIARALQDIMVNFGDRLDKLVINMSLTLNMPLEEKHFNEGDEMGLEILKSKPKPEWFWNLLHWICRIIQLFFPRLRCRWSWFDRQAMPLEWISDLVYMLGPSMVAAAGNNAANGYRPSALYPAAFDSVLGVGALSRGAPWRNTTPLAPATYSDLADTPTTQGVVAFGGEEGEGNGVLGVYVGNIPDGTPNGTPNPTGWAWWAGTSFATPIISGLVAAWVIGKEVASTREAINKLLDIAKQQPNIPDTPEGEWIVPVEQH